eukprot:3474858-Rhodomonas_salina.2
MWHSLARTQLTGKTCACGRCTPCALLGRDHRKRDVTMLIRAGPCGALGRDHGHCAVTMGTVP